VKTNQKNAMQQGGACGVGRLHSCASRQLSVGSRRTEPNSQVLPCEVFQARLAMVKR
jgi:hypothetical protein